MEVIMAIEIGVVLAIALVFWLFYPRKPKRSKKVSQKLRKEERLSVARAKQARPYQAVSVASYGGGCSEVASIAGQRFLVKVAPLIPLQGCASNHCNCRYVRHDDRRHLGRDRRLGVGMVSEIFEVSETQDRRYQKSPGRRKTDLAA